jgi:hypothetical protein
VALGFASDLRRIATQASTVGEDAFGNLRDILDEALGRIRTEVFKPPAGPGEAEAAGGAEADTGAGESAATAEAGGEPGESGPADESGAAAETGGEPGESGPADESGTAAEAGGEPGDGTGDRTTR